MSQIKLKCIYYSLKKIGKFISQTIEKYWAIPAFFTLVPTLFSLFLAYAGESTGFVVLSSTGGRILAPRGWVAFGILFFIAFVMALVNKYNQKPTKNDKVLEEEEKERFKIFEQVLSELNEGCDKKSNTQLKYIHETVNGEIDTIVDIYTHPSNQIDQLLDIMRSQISKLLEIKDQHYVKKDELFISLAYKINESNPKWKWANVEYKSGLTFNELEAPTEDGRISTFRHLLNGKSNIKFFNSKQKAYDENHYLPDENDDPEEKIELKGSIACYKFNLTYADVRHMQAVLTVSTYNKKFTLDKYEEIIRINFRDFIFPTFVRQLKVELCNLLVHHLYEKNQINQNNRLEYEELFG